MIESFLGQIYDAMGPETFVLADLIDWMHDVMDKDDDKWGYGYKRTNLLLSPAAFLKAGIVQALPLGQRYFRGTTLERLERVSNFLKFELLPNLY